MTLTVKEKEHWKNSIDRKVNRAIEKIYAMGEPEFRERIQNEARKMAFESIGILELQDRLDVVIEIIRSHEQERREIDKQIDALIRSRCMECKPGSFYEFNTQAAVKLRRNRFERELLAQDPLGQKILTLKDEQEELLDTVWLATSSAQIKELWSRVSKLLDQPPTGLQQEALDIPADSSAPKE